MFEDENNNTSVYGKISLESPNENNNLENIGSIQKNNLPTEQGLWSKFKCFWLQDIDWNTPIVVELSPYQQKIEDEINDFLHQEITWEKVHDFLFQDVKIGKKKNA